jgi:hypothetical protein
MDTFGAKFQPGQDSNDPRRARDERPRAGGRASMGSNGGDYRNYGPPNVNGLRNAAVSGPPGSLTCLTVCRS